MSISDLNKNTIRNPDTGEVEKPKILDKFYSNGLLRILQSWRAPSLIPRAVNRLSSTLTAYRIEAAPRDQILACVVLVSGILISIGGYFAIQGSFKDQAQREFDASATRFLKTLGDSIDSNLGVLATAEKLFQANDEVTRWQFFDLAQEVLPDHPGIRSMQWVPRVPAGQRSAYEAAAKKDGLFDFMIATPGGSEVASQATSAPDLLPIFYLEPFQGNEGRIGIDLSAEPQELALLQAARDAGKMTIKPTRLVSENAPIQAGFVAALPIYSSEGLPFTVEDRRRKLVGYLRVLFDLRVLIDAALPGLTAPPGVDIYIFDAASAERRLVHYHPSPLRTTRGTAPLTEAEAMRGLFSSKVHALADGKWSIVVKPVSSHFVRNVQIASWAFLAVLLLMTASLVQYLVTSQTRTRTIERSVRERTAALEAEISERKRVEQELRSAKKQAEVANLSKSEFLAMMSHELRTPLNAVLGFAEVISGEMVGPIGNERYRRYGEDILASGTHLLSLINDILDLSKIEAQKYELVEENLDISEIWETVRGILQPNITASGLDLVIDVPTDLPQVRADQRAIRQILINLLSNAIKFTPKGGEIHVIAEIDEAGGFTMCVEDTGIGIAKEDLASVLEPFKQVDSSLARKYEGTGLGLPLTKRLVEMHEGKLEIDSTLGEGTVVRLTLGAHRVVRKRPKRAAGQAADIHVEGAA